MSRNHSVFLPVLPLSVAKEGRRRTNPISASFSDAVCVSDLSKEAPHGHNEDSLTALPIRTRCGSPGTKFSPHPAFTISYQFGHVHEYRVNFLYRKKGTCI